MLKQKRHLRVPFFLFGNDDFRSRLGDDFGINQNKPALDEMEASVSYTDSALWRATLAPHGQDDRYENARTRLRESFRKTRNAVIPLVEKIAHELPNLTVHDVSHLDSLWAIADVILGPDYPINPAEAYVLGVAFLLHDAATSSFAYPDGIQGIRETVEWKDIVAQFGGDATQLRTGAPGYESVLFETLRLLHAKQAAKLPTQTWKDLDGRDRHLIEDVELRNHYGRFIGRVAASHGEDAGTVEAEWAHAAPVPPHSSLGLDAGVAWEVDMLKLTMLIRCIDAAHIDSARAPDGRAAVTTLSGESKKHWVFQNKLSAIAIGPRNELYWSSSPFAIENADAWWQCYETCQMIDRELKTANRILIDNGRRSLRAQGVIGAADIEIFQRNIPVEGWHPLDFNFQVSQIGQVIEKFGGEKLYGDKPYLALRELIQNSADAIRARRLYNDDPTRGKITISLRQVGDQWWLDVQDDGLGMSRYVLTEVLLDFGRSLWKDGALRDQWSGLASKGFKAVGQYGIGFFSVFMLGDEVKVTSWRFGTGIDQQLTLHLRDRVRERPILLMTEAPERLHEPGTRISVRLNQGRASLLRKVHRVGLDVGKGDLESLRGLIGHLAPALDIDVWCRDGDAHATRVIEANDWQTIEAEQLLRRLDLNLNDNAITSYGRLMRPLFNSNDEMVGRAAIYADGRRYFWLGDRGDGILAHKGILAGSCFGMVGVLLSENSVDLARQKAEPIASGDTVRSWANEQSSLASNEGPAFSERAVSLGVFEKGLIVGVLNGEEVSVSELIDFFIAGEKTELICVVDEIECPDDISHRDFEELKYCEDVLDLTGCSPARRFDFGMEGWIEGVLPADQGEPRTVLALIAHFLNTEVKDLTLDEDNRIVAELGDISFKENCLVFRRIDT